MEDESPDLSHLVKIPTPKDLAKIEELAILDACLTLDEFIVLLQRAKTLAVGVKDLRVCVSVPGQMMTRDVSVIFPPVVMDGLPNTSFICICARKEA